jgi:DNA-binding MarR family transcriptional regulator
MDEVPYEDSCMHARLLLEKARHFMLYARQKEMAPYHVSPQQAHLLFILNRLGHRANLSELSKLCYKGIGTISLQISRMENDGLVEKIREAPKAKVFTIGLTPKGLEICQSTNRIKSDKIIMSILSEEERQQLILLLNKISTDNPLVIT